MRRISEAEGELLRLADLFDYHLIPKLTYGHSISENTEWPTYKRVYIDVDYRYKELAKALNARWDKEKKLWYFVTSGINSWDVNENSFLGIISRWFKNMPMDDFKYGLKLTYYSGKQILDAFGFEYENIRFSPYGAIFQCSGCGEYYQKGVFVGIDMEHSQAYCPDCAFMFPKNFSQNYENLKYAEKKILQQYLLEKYGSFPPE